MIVKTEAPKWLSDREKEIFNEIPVNDKSDMSAAAMLAVSICIVEKIHKAIKAHGFHPSTLGILNTATRIVHELANQFGMTPKSREGK